MKGSSGPLGLGGGILRFGDGGYDGPLKGNSSMRGSSESVDMMDLLALRLGDGHRERLFRDGHREGLSNISSFPTSVYTILEKHDC